MRSRTVRRPLACWRAILASPPICFANSARRFISSTSGCQLKYAPPRGEINQRRKTEGEGRECQDSAQRGGRNSAERGTVSRAEQYRARKQAVARRVNRLLTRAILFRPPRCQNARGTVPPAALSERARYCSARRAVRTASARDTCN